MGLYRFFRICLVQIIIAMGLADSATAQSPVSFPWNCSQTKTIAPHAVSPGSVPIYRTLGGMQPSQAAQPIIIQALPPQQAYAYGWFGSNAAGSWNRHFGYFKAHTQWAQH